MRPNVGRRWLTATGNRRRLRGDQWFRPDRLDDGDPRTAASGRLRVSPKTVRAFEAGADGLEVIAIGSDRPEGETACGGTAGSMRDGSHSILDAALVVLRCSHEIRREVTG